MDRSDPQTGNLWALRDRFVGRSELLSELHRQVLGGVRLLVLVGPGGIGKTRLARELGEGLRSDLCGIWVFDLAEARSEPDVCARVAKELGVELSAEEPVAQLGRVLAAKRRVLLVLDGLEGCAALLPRTLGRWLDLAPEATFLGTSRTRPRLRGERVVSLGPLSPSSAEALFVERADRPLTSDELAHVGPLCRALEGIPLAIELAAARVGLLGVEQIRRRLSLSLLSGGAAERPDRHRSLEASLDWSRDLLTPSARSALGQLTVFEGGFTLDAAEAVLDLSGASAVDVLAELVDASLLRVDAHTRRFCMLDVVRRYGQARITADDAAGAEIRHGDFFARFGTPASLGALDGPEGPRCCQALRLELGNLVAACRHATSRGDGAAAVANLRAAWGVLDLQGPYPLAIELADEILGSSGLTAGQRAAVGLVAGHALRLSGRVEPARRQLEESLRLCRMEGDSGTEASVLGQLAGVAAGEGRGAEARELYTEELAMLRRLGDPQAIGKTLGNLANALSSLGEVDRAIERYGEALAVLRSAGSRRAEAVILGNLGEQLRECGRLDEARTHLDAALVRLREVGSHVGEGSVLGNLGSVLFEQGQMQEALEHYEAAIAVHREFGNLRSEGIVLANLGVLQRSVGRLDEARALQEQALQVQQQLGNRRGEAVALGNLGELDLDRGRTALARTRLEEALRTARDIRLSRLEGYLLARLSRIALMQGDAERAASLAEQGADVLRTADARPLLAEVLSLRAEVALRQRDPEAARRALAEAESSSQRALPRLRAIEADQQGAGELALRYASSLDAPEGRRERLWLELRYGARPPHAIADELAALLDQAIARQDAFEEAQLRLLLARCSPRAAAFDQAQTALFLASDWPDLAARARLLLLVHGGAPEGPLPDDAESGCLARLALLRQSAAAHDVAAALEAIHALPEPHVRHVLALADASLSAAGIGVLARGAGSRVILDPKAREIWVDGAQVARFGARALGFELLDAIAAGRASERGALFEAVWKTPYRPPSSDNAMSVGVHRLRKKLTTLSIEGTEDGGYALAGDPFVIRLGLGVT